MKKRAIRICPVCGNEIVENIRHISMDIPSEFTLPNNYDIVGCEKCGFVYADTAATMENYDTYYSKCNVYSDTPNLSLGLTRYEMLEEVFKQFLTKNMNMLDIGVGNGNFDIEIKNKGYNIEGIDPSKSSIQKLNERGIKGYVGSIYDKPLITLEKRYDVVFIFDVFEHLLFPDKAIVQIDNYLTDKGQVYIAIPDYSKISDNNTPLSNNFNQEHINYFSEVAIDNLMQTAGYTTIYHRAIVIENNGYMQYEMIQGYQKLNLKMNNIKDVVTGEAVKKYFLQEDEKELRRFNMISKLAISKRSIVIWGTGALTMYLFANSDLKKCNINGYIDNNPSKHNVMFGVENHKYSIISPNEINNDDDLIVISSMLYSKNIEDQIKIMGLKNEVLTL